jgi:hypothetical protein
MASQRYSCPSTSSCRCALVCISFWISLRFNRQCSTSAEQTHHVNCGDDLL